MMRRIIGLIVLVLFPSWTLTAIAQSDVKERTDAARAVAADFGLTLIAELQKAIAAGGPVNAIGVCHLCRAQDRGGEVGRKEDVDWADKPQASAAQECAR